MIGQTVSHYRILSKLGEGGMGRVYVAEDTLLGRQVAIKSLTIPAVPGQRHFRTRFLREARAASLLNHPHIATIHDYGETEDGQPYLVMELVDGQNLSELLRKDALPVERAVAIIRQVTEAIAEAHRHGIVHRDIKPSNIALNQRNEVKVLDFGLAKQIESEVIATQKLGVDADLTATHTLEGVILGTPLYLSPEQALGTTVDARSDIFSLGSLLYECLTGTPAFAGKTVGEICARVIRDDPSPPSKLNPLVSADLDRITLKALTKEVEARYQTAEDLLADLRTADLNLGRHTPRQTLGIKSISTQLRSSIKHLTRIPAWVVLALASLILVSAIWLSFKSRNSYEPAPEAQKSYLAGTVALRNATYLKARDLFEEAIRNDARFPLAHARLAETWMELDYEEKATTEMLRVTELAPDLSALTPLDMLYVQAITGTVRRNYAGAVASFEEIVRRLPEEQKAPAYFDLGRAYERMGDVNRAVGAFEEMTRRDPQAAAAFLRLGSLYSRRQEEANAFAAFDKAEALYSAQSNLEGSAEVFYQRGAYFNLIDKLSEAQKQLSRALDLAIMANSKSQQIKTLLQLGNTSYSTGDTIRAEQYATRAIELARAEQLDNLTTHGLIDIGNVFFIRGEYAETQKWFEEALQVAKANKGRRAEARASLSLGSLFVQQRKGAQAVDFLEPALAFYRQANFRREMLQALLLLAYANEQQGNNQAALESLNEQLKLAQEVNDVAQLAHTHAAIGLLLSHQERFTEALSHFDESYKLNQSLKLEPKTGYDLVNRGNLLWQLGRYRDARDAFKEAFDVATRSGGGDKRLLAWIQLFQARMALSELRYGDAIVESRKASAIADIEDKDFSVQISYTKGLAQLKSGIVDAGASACQKAFDIAGQRGDPRLISSAQLALAEALLLKNDAANSLTIALQSQQTFARMGSRHSEWRAWLIAAQASRQSRDETKVAEYAVHAAGLLTALEKTLGTNEYSSYLSRPDVQRDKKLLNELLPGATN